MMLRLGDDGVVSKVNEADLVYIDENDLKGLLEEYNQLREENELLQNQKKFLIDFCADYMPHDTFTAMFETVNKMEKEES